MQSKIHKKITSPVEILHKISFGIATTFIAIFLFGLFMPFSQSFAQTETDPIKISFLPANPELNNTIKVTARTYNLKDKKITFYSLPKVQGFDNSISGIPGATCTANTKYSPGIWGCFVSFQSSAKNIPSYIIEADVIDNNGNEQNDRLTVDFVPQKTPPVCTDPKKLNDAKDACVCIDPKQDIKTDCKPSVLSTSGLKISLTIDKADALNLKKGELVKATVSSNKPISGKTISFSLSGSLFTPSSTCTMSTVQAAIQSCSVNFTPNVEGPLILSASVTIKNSTTNVDELFQADLPVTIKKEITTPPLIVPLNCVPPQKLNADKTACITDTDTTYTPLAPLPGLGDAGCNDKDGNPIKDKATGKIIPCIDTKPNPTSNPCPFGNYLNIIIKIVIGLAAVLAMVMIVYGGIEYMTSELVSGKEAGKDTIKNAILGLLLALGAFLILNTINPQLLSACLDKLPQATIVIEPESAREYKLSQTLTTDTKFKKTSYYDKIKTISATNNIPNCLLQVAVQRESNGIPNQIGHDEDVPFLGVPSRKTFINSGIKYDKTTFTPSNDLITKSSFKNNDSKSGQDWRFSHSVGLFGVTFGPNNRDSTGAQEILNNVDKDIEAAVKIMKRAYESCGKNIEKTFRMYQSGSCNGGENNPKAFVNKETPLRVSLYNQCVI